MRIQVAKMSVRLPVLLEVLQEVEIRQSARCWLFVRRDAAGRRVTVEEARDEVLLLPPIQMRRNADNQYNNEASYAH